MQAIANNLSDKTDVQDMNDSSSVEILEDTTSLFSNDNIMFPDESVERPYTRYGYQISELNFLVPENVGSEVIQEPNIFMLPNAPAWIEGLINIRGNIIPVMNVDKLLEQKTKKKMKSILVLEKSVDASAIAILISVLPVSLELNDSKSSTTSYPDGLSEYLDDGFVQNGSEWVEFNLQKLFRDLSGK